MTTDRDLFENEKYTDEINRLNRLYKDYFKKYHSLKRVEHYVKYLKEELDKYEVD